MVGMTLSPWLGRVGVRSWRPVRTGRATQAVSRFLSDRPFPATSEPEKINFHLLNKNTGHRIKHRKFDAAAGDGAASTRRDNS